MKKFEAKRTTDDCYTPDVVYDAVAEWVASEYNVSRANFVRPFYPGGDYQNEKLIGWQGGYYGVTRAYQRPDSDDLELTLEQKLEYIDGIEEVSA